VPSQSQATNFAPHDAQLSAVAKWLSEARPTADPAVTQRARLLVLDTLGCALAGMRHDEVAAYAARLASGSDVTCPGFPDGLTPSHFGQAMTIAACWDEACEGLALAHGRPGLHAVPAAVALALDTGASLADTLDALVVGYEIGGRLGAAWRIRSSMHVDGTWGTLGAAAAAAALLHHRAQDQILAAIDAAACMIPASLYAPARQGATTRNLYAAQAVSRGIETALALAAGVTAPRQTIGEAAALVFDPAQAVALAPPGDWLVMQGYFKPFAAVRHVHYGAQAARDWRDQFGNDTASITAIRLQTYPEAITYCGNRAPRSAIQAQFSLTYGLAHTLARGDLGPEAYDAAALNDPEICRLEALVVVEETDEFPTGRGVHLSVTAGSGETRVAVDRVDGDPDQPMLPDAVVAKFHKFAEPRLGVDAAMALAARIMEAPLNQPLATVLNGA
jgi:2-methylcitrate dehydratase PrpD